MNTARATQARIRRRIDSTQWRKTAREIKHAGETRNYTKVWDLINELLGKKSRRHTTPSHTAISKAYAAIKNTMCKGIDEEAARHADIAIHEGGTTPLEFNAERWYKVYTDGACRTIRSSGSARKVASCAVYCPALAIADSCMVHPFLKHTAPLAEVLAILLALRKLRHAPSGGFHFYSDNKYVVDVINFKLEILQQQRFSDVAHADIWKAITAELIFQRRPISATRIPIHTGRADADSRANDTADTLAKEATRREAGLSPCPELHTHDDNYLSAVRGGIPEQWEITRGISDLANSAPGPDTVTAEELKSPEVRQLINTWFTQMWENGRVPADVSAAMISFIPKKSGDSRPLSLSNTIYKVLMNIIKNRCHPSTSSATWISTGARHTGSHTVRRKSIANHKVLRAHFLI
jgi:ribonuclease HI